MCRTLGDKFWNREPITIASPFKRVEGDNEQYDKYSFVTLHVPDCVWGPQPRRRGYNKSLFHFEDEGQRNKDAWQSEGSSPMLRALRPITIG